MAELAVAAGVEEEDAIDALDSMNAYSTRSLHAQFEEGSDDSLGDKLGTDETGFRDVEDGALVAAGLDALDDRERQIVELRFFNEMTQSQIASEMGISQMHVSRLLRRALATMRGRIEEGSAVTDPIVVRLSFPAKPDYLLLARLALSGLARELPMDDELLADLKLAVTEACGNAVRHAYAPPAAIGEVTVSFIASSTEIVMTWRIRVADSTRRSRTTASPPIRSWAGWE